MLLIGFTTPAHAWWNKETVFAVSENRAVEAFDFRAHRHAPGGEGLDHARRREQGECDSLARR